jgi:PAS domain S-box-containing protein
VYISSYALLDRNGVDVVDTYPEDVGVLKSDRDYFKAPLENGVPYISPVRISQTTFEPSIYFSAPVRNADGTVIGVLRSRYNATFLQNLLLEFSDTSHSEEHAVLVDNETFVRIAHTQDYGLIFKSYETLSADQAAELQAELRLRPGELEEVQSPQKEIVAGIKNLGNQSVFNAPSQIYDGENTYTGGFKVENADWTVLVERTERSIFEPIQSQTRAITITALVILLMAAGAGIFVAQLLSQPLVQLTNVAGEIASGNFTMRAREQTHDEIGALAKSFNYMTDQLYQTLTLLEQRVADRTKDLATVAEVGTATSSILEVDQLLQNVVDLTKERFNLYHSHMLEKGLSIPLNREQSLVARAARERQGITVNDVRQAPDFLPNPLLPDTRSELAVPLIVGDKVIGVFDVQSNIVGRFTDADIDIQTTLAAQVAVSVQNARQYNESMRFRLGIENSGDAVFATDVKGTIIYANPAFEKVYGYAPAEVIGKNPRIIKSGLLTSENYQTFWGSLLSKQSVTGEIVNKDKDGRLVYIAGTNSAIVNDAGEIIGFLAVHHDITEQKHTQELVAQRAQQQEAINQITQKIQNAATIESALQVAARELGHALGRKPTLVQLDPLMDSETPASIS